jgi:hypothetical protein
VTATPSVQWSAAGWDGKPLQALTKNSPARATGAHIAIVGHVTRDELVRLLNATEAANGFLNRYLLFCVRRSKLLPEGGRIDEIDWQPLLTKLRAAIDTARRAGRLRFDEHARRRWWELYPTLTEPEAGLAGAVCARAEAHVVRLSLLYALLDQAQQIRLPHLEATLALWEYAAASARWVFGDSLGDPLADEIYRALLEEPNGLTRSQLRDLFSRNRRSKDIAQALDRLAATGRIHAERLHQRGRPAELWRARHDQLPPPDRRFGEQSAPRTRSIPQSTTRDTSGDSDMSPTSKRSTTATEASPGIVSFTAYGVTTFKTRLQRLSRQNPPDQPRDTDNWG